MIPLTRIGKGCPRACNTPCNTDHSHHLLFDVPEPSDPCHLDSMHRAAHPMSGLWKESFARSSSGCQGEMEEGTRSDCRGPAGKKRSAWWNTTSWLSDR